MSFKKFLQSIFHRSSKSTTTTTTTTTILRFVSGLIANRTKVEKDILALSGVETLSGPQKQNMVDQLFGRFLQELVPGQMTIEKLRNLVAEKFDQQSIFATGIIELFPDEDQDVVELSKKVSENCKQAFARGVPIEKLSEVVASKTEDTLLAGVVVNTDGSLDFSLAEARYFKLPPQWLKLVQNFLSRLDMALVSLETDVDAMGKKTTNHPDEQHPSQSFSLDVHRELSHVGLEALVSEGRMRDVQAQLLSASGESIPAILTGKIIRTNKGEKGGMIVTAKDLRILKKYAKSRLDIITPVLQKVATGDFSEKIAVPEGEDEFTEHLVALNLMTDDFRKMVEEVKQKQEEMEAQNEELEEASAELEESKTGLEEKVKERTEALEKAKIGLEGQVAERTTELQKLNTKLEEEVTSRTQDLQDKLLELERFNKVAVGRELKMVELKEEIARLKGATKKNVEIGAENSQKPAEIGVE